MVYRYEQTKPNKINQHVQLEANVKKENIITNYIATVLKIINIFIDSSKINYKLFMYSFIQHKYTWMLNLCHELC